jgi:hypothetical protein
MNNNDNNQAFPPKGQQQFQPQVIIVQQNKFGGVNDDVIGPLIAGLLAFL